MFVQCRHGNCEYGVRTCQSTHVRGYTETLDRQTQLTLYPRLTSKVVTILLPLSHQ